MPATAYLVGAGPGDPGLITVRGMRVLAQAQVLVFDSPCHPDMIDLAPAEAERASVGNWPDGSALLVERARAGLTVVRPKSGARSPSVAEAQALAEAGLAFEIVPGTSGRSLPPASPVFRRRRRGCPQRSAMPSCSRDRPQPGTSNLDRLVAGR
ncbi:MAG TPA: HemD protein, partial [Myxococcales bacterium]|nr:HemD protein [Myxococcales bacterium]